MFGREPAVIMGLVGAAIALGVGFGLPVTPAQVGLIMAFVSAGLAFATRSQVAPKEDIQTALNMPQGSGKVLLGKVIETGVIVQPSDTKAEVAEKVAKAEVSK